MLLFVLDEDAGVVPSLLLLVEDDDGDANKTEGGNNIETLSLDERRKF